MEEQKKPEQEVNSNEENTSNVENNQSESKEPVADASTSSVSDQPERTDNVGQETANESNEPTTGVEEYKALAIIGYVVPILFFIPLLTEAKDNQFAKFHANQQLNLLIAGFIVSTVGTFIPFLGWFIILPLGSLVLLILAIMGIINVVKGEMKELPIIGKYQLIK